MGPTAPILLSPYAYELPQLRTGSQSLPLYDSREPVPLFVCFMISLSCDVHLLLLRLHIFLARLFLTAEDYRLTCAPGVIFDSLSELTEESRSSLRHLSTSPMPMLGPAHASLAAQGLGQIGDYLISDDLWSAVAPPRNLLTRWKVWICVVCCRLASMVCL